MTMPSSGALNMGGTSSPVSVAQELGLSLTATISMNDSNVRTLAGVGGSGTSWSMSSLYGKSNRVSLSYTFASNTANASLNLSGIGGYVAGKSDITVTVNSGIYLYATTTGNYGLNITGGTTGDTLTIVNNGYIMGAGGVGGSPTYINGLAGGPALNIPINATINNTNGSAYIGGGGGGGAWSEYGCDAYGGGGGAGGGNGGWYAGGYGGAGGGIGASGATASVGYGGGGGGRIFPGTTSGFSAYGAGGQAGGGGANNNSGGGLGGGSNNAGGNANYSYGCGGGGGWGAKGGNGGSVHNYVGASGGKAVNLNGKTVTWTSGNTSRVWGAVS